LADVACFRGVAPEVAQEREQRKQKKKKEKKRNGNDLPSKHIRERIRGWCRGISRNGSEDGAEEHPGTEPGMVVPGRAETEANPVARATESGQPSGEDRVPMVRDEPTARAEAHQRVGRQRHRTEAETPAHAPWQPGPHRHRKQRHNAGRGKKGKNISVLSDMQGAYAHMREYIANRHSRGRAGRGRVR